MPFLRQFIEDDFDTLIVMTHVEVDLDAAVGQGLLRWLAFRLCYF